MKNLGISSLKIALASFATGACLTHAAPVLPGPGGENGARFRHACGETLDFSRARAEVKCAHVIRSYADAVASIQRTRKTIEGVTLKTGIAIPCDDGQDFRAEDEASYQRQLDNVDLSDILAQSYPRSYAAPVTAKNFSPGRLRNDQLLAAAYVYSDEKAAEVSEIMAKPALDFADYQRLSNIIYANIVKVDFLGRKIAMNKRNGAARALYLVGQELESKPALAKWLVDTREMSGGFNVRPVSGTKRFSGHAWGIAVDFTIKTSPANVQWFDAYWKWVAKCEPCSPARTDQGAKERIDLGEDKLQVQIFPENFDHFPKELVSIFEKHGFIWGGNWHHFDTMHFEYRPEFFALRGNPACAALEH